MYGARRYGIYLRVFNLICHDQPLSWSGYPFWNKSFYVSNNMVIIAEQCCSTNDVVQCSALMKQQWLFMVVEIVKKNIDRSSLFAIVIIVAHPCWPFLTVLMVEQCWNNIVFMPEQACWQHCSRGAAQPCSQLAAQCCSRLLTTCNRLCVFTRVV